MVAMCALLVVPIAWAGANIPEPRMDSVVMYGFVDVNEVGPEINTCYDRGTVFVALLHLRVAYVRVESDCGDTGGVYRASDLKEGMWTITRVNVNNGYSYGYVGMGMTIHDFFLYARDIDPQTQETRRLEVSGDPPKVIDLDG
jgi:hypothetical protein